MPYADKTRMREYIDLRREDRRKLLDSLKDRPCADCGKKYPPYVMEFDHLRDKRFQISPMWSVGLKRLMEEVDKCEVVCSNCHAIRTHNRLGH